MFTSHPNLTLISRGSKRSLIRGWAFLLPCISLAARMLLAWYYGDVSTYRVARLGVEDFELEEKKQGRTVHNESGQTNFSRPGPETGGRNRSCEHHDDDALIIALQIVQRARRRNF